MAASAQTQLMAKANEKVNGSVAVANIEFSILGTLTASGVTVTDRQNVVAAKADRVLISFGVGDVLAGRADLSAVKSVTLDNPVVSLVSGKDGRWNWEDLVKSGQEEPSFRGKVTVKQGSLLVNTGAERKLEAINGSVDFAKYPALGFDLTGKTGATPLAATGSWTSGGDGELSVKAEQAQLADLPLGALTGGDLRLTGGTARNISVTVTRKAGKFSLAGSGAVEKLAAGAAGYAITEGTGKITLADGKIGVNEAAMLVNGQKVTMSGSVAAADAGLTLGLDLSAASFDPAALAATPLQGPLSFQARLEGTPAAPVARGTFAIPQGSFGAISFANGSGNFVYGGGTLTLTDTKAIAWDGSLAIQGDIVPASQQYRLTANGRGVDSALLTEKDIRGRVDFDASLSGQGASGGYAAGNFRMGEGSFSGIPFLAMTGDFVKQGDNTRFHNIVVRTVTGSFSAEGLTEGAVVRLRKIGGVADPRESLEKAITDKLSPNLKKLLPGR